MADQNKYMQKLKGRKVLVFGGSSGIGYGVAEASVENGCTVIIASSSLARVEKAVSQLQAAYPSAKDRISGRACNLGEAATLESNIQALLEEVGAGIDHIVHSAGEPLTPQKLQDLTLDSLVQAGLVRYFAPILIAKHARKYLTPGVQSSITLTSGAVADRPMPNAGPLNGYATGLQGLVRGLALDLKPIRVNLVSPGPVDTELRAGLSPEQKKAFESMAMKLLTGRAAIPADVAESYLYLMRDQNITGEDIRSNGGYLLV